MVFGGIVYVTLISKGNSLNIVKAKSEQLIK